MSVTNLILYFRPCDLYVSRPIAPKVLFEQNPTKIEILYMNLFYTGFQQILYWSPEETLGKWHFHDDQKRNVRWNEANREGSEPG